MKPNKKNFCGGNFSDWLEVMLIDKCNGRCQWCIEKEGYHPSEHVTWQKLADSIEKTGKKNIILLGGEPPLYVNLREIINKLSDKGMNVYLTTNGSRITPAFVKECLLRLRGINISIHDYDLTKNRHITGINLNEENLKKAINSFISSTVRLNCNLIKGNIDSYEQIHHYIEFAKRIGADSVRFAELKNSESEFVDLTDIFGSKYGINNEPFGLGCNTDVVLERMPVNFRQMCGLQTNKRTRPQNPEQAKKQVMYYDGNIYDGWQRKDIIVMINLIKMILEENKKGNIADSVALNILNAIKGDENSVPQKKEKPVSKKVSKKAKEAKEYVAASSIGCQY